MRRHGLVRHIGPVTVLLALAASACAGTPTPAPAPTPASRLAAIPPGAVKATPAEDPWPPEARADWSKPMPLGAPVDTAGAEDSPYITPDGQTLYFFFTPDVRVPVEKQLLDGVTGIWITQWAGEGWANPTWVSLASPGVLHLDGCPCAWNDLLYFCSARAENHRDVDMYVARWDGAGWTDTRNLGQQLNEGYGLGEMHLTADGRFLYFGSDRPGGLGGRDLWACERVGEGWGVPVNLGPTVNTPGDEDRPFVTVDGQELWFDGASRQGRPGPAVFRSLRQPDGSWGKSEEVISSFAGEPTLTGDGRTLYFVHHYFTADLGQMIEADIYVTRRIGP